MDRRTLLTLPALGVGLAAVPALAEEKMTTGFLDRSLKTNAGEMPYVVYIPRAYASRDRWPVILFLHGAGERGSDGLKQTQVGLPGAVRMLSERYPAIVVMPQCATGQRWDGPMAEGALRALDSTMREFHCHEDRQYLTGLSMGGFGSFLLAAAHPDRFAAVVPVCGGGDPAAMAPRLKETPLWIFHGDQDTAVPVARSRDMVEALKAAGGTKFRYTEYAGVGHNSWDRAYAEKELAEWLFAQKRGGG